MSDEHPRKPSAAAQGAAGTQSPGRLIGPRFPVRNRGKSAAGHVGGRWNGVEHAPACDAGRGCLRAAPTSRQLLAAAQHSEAEFPTS
jgi:hypothetical protein